MVFAGIHERSEHPGAGVTTGVLGSVVGSIPIVKTGKGLGKAVHHTTAILGRRTSSSGCFVVDLWYS